MVVSAKHLLLVIVVLGICKSAPLAAQMYICRDASGKVSYTNVPSLSGCTALNSSPKTSGLAESFWRPDSGIYDGIIKRASVQYGVNYYLIKAMIRTESNFRPRAVSHKGAQGLMQLMPTTARDVGVRNSFNPWDNVSGGTRYFRRQLDSFHGDVIMSLAAYNAGPTLVRRLGRVPHNGETERYVQKVLYHYRMYKSYGR